MLVAALKVVEHLGCTASRGGVVDPKNVDALRGCRCGCD
jgi:hypothetical protein